MKKLTLVVIFIMSLTGCFESKKTVHDVDWFKSHNSERRTVLNECINDLGEFKDHPNCINAKQAEKELTVGQLPTLQFGG
ncbi:EexN family lipoprotein (plasmid) [Vibrio parahaemolyticus]